MNSENLHEWEIKEKKEFNKAIYEELEKTELINLFKKHLDPIDYEINIKIPIEIYEELMEDNIN